MITKTALKDGVLNSLQISNEIFNKIDEENP